MMVFNFRKLFNRQNRDKNKQNNTTMPEASAPIIFLPVNLLKALATLYKYIDTEFLVEMPIKEMEKNIFKVEPKVFIPDMELEYATVYAETSLGEKTFVLHTHPGDIDTFSAIDEQSINAQSFISALITQRNLEQKKYIIDDIRYQGQKPDYYSVVYYESPIEVLDVGLITYHQRLLDPIATQQFIESLFAGDYRSTNNLAKRLFNRNNKKLSSLSM